MKPCKHFEIYKNQKNIFKGPKMFSIHIYSITYKINLGESFSHNKTTANWHHVTYNRILYIFDLHTKHLWIYFDMYIVGIHCMKCSSYREYIHLKITKVNLLYILEMLNLNANILNVKVWKIQLWFPLYTLENLIFNVSHFKWSLWSIILDDKI